MKNEIDKHGLNLKLAIAAIIFSSTSGQVLGQGGTGQAEIEEVVVTGSFIRRTEGFRASSPITQISADDIAQFGTTRVGDMISSMSFNNGTPTSANILGTGASTATSSSINLRGLGYGATLSLVDGLRVNGGNVNVFLPQIAIQRLDIVTDGAAALYGTSAVAGVANFIPVKAYDGIKIESFLLGDSRGDYEEGSLSLLWGGDWNGFNVVGALEASKNSNLGFLDRPEQFTSGLSLSSTGSPGNYNVPRRDANGNLTSAAPRNLPDPNCGKTYEDPTQPFNNKAGYLIGSICYLEIGEWHDYKTAQDGTTAFANISYDFDNDASIAFQTSLFERETFVRRSPTSSGGNIADLPVIRGEIPGNPFRAVTSTGTPLFAQDSNGDGIPDRDANNVVILDPNGIPFNEDVSFNRWRPITKHGTLSSALNSDGTRRGGTIEDGYRAVLSAEFPVPLIEGWRGSSAVTHQITKNESPDLNYSVSKIAQALNCDVLANRDSCFNPFYSIDPSTLNTQETVDGITMVQASHSKNRLITWDNVLSGTFEPGGFQLPGGAIGAAIGYQWIQTYSDFKEAEMYKINDAFNGSQGFDTTYKRNTRSVFSELSLPLLDNADVQLAVRNEKYSTGHESTDAKYGAVYSPFDNFTMRVSAGTSFIVPTVAQLTRPESCGLQSLEDRFSTFASFTQTCATGNPLLTPETADTLSVGLTWQILDGLVLDLDWTETDFVDRIVSTGAADIMTADFANYVSAYGQPATPDGKPTLQQLATWVADPRSDKRIVRSPSDLSFIERVFTSASNASSELVQAADMKLRYSFSVGNSGNFMATMNATYLFTHMVQLKTTEPAFEAVGKQNDRTGAVPPLPRWKGDVGLGWNKERHAARISARYLGAVDYEGALYPFQAAFNPNYNPVSRLESETIVDLSYSYGGIRIYGGLGEFTVGSRNIFDNMPTGLPSLGGMEAFLHDPIGRTVYARFTYTH
ncbi:MAG: TonB-dependent receptor [Pseudohongiella sp.]|nr:TonB-dependent receptor [Pseudohongiella sp.]